MEKSKYRDILSYTGSDRKIILKAFFIYLKNYLSQIKAWDEFLEELPLSEKNLQKLQLDRNVFYRKAINVSYKWYAENCSKECKEEGKGQFMSLIGKLRVINTKKRKWREAKSRINQIAQDVYTFLESQKREKELNESAYWKDLDLTFTNH